MLRRALGLLANLLLASSLAGLALLGASEAAIVGGLDLPGLTAPTTPATTNAEASTRPPPERGSRTIVGLSVPSIGLDAEVTEAAFIQRNGAPTWDVPAFKAGHAQYTAGAGEVGNAVLLGHVTSRSAGNVFQELERVQSGDMVELRSESGDRFDYRVTDVRAVPRDDTSVLQPTPTPTVSLITCTGMWLPFLWDYTQRLVVQGELES